MRVNNHKPQGLIILLYIFIALMGVISGCKATAPQPTVVMAESKWFASSSLLMNDSELINKLSVSAGLEDDNEIAGL